MKNTISFTKIIILAFILLSTFFCIAITNQHRMVILTISLMGFVFSFLSFPFVPFRDYYPGNPVIEVSINRFSVYFMQQHMARARIKPNAQIFMLRIFKSPVQFSHAAPAVPNSIVHSTHKQQRKFLRNAVNPVGSRNNVQ